MKLYQTLTPKKKKKKMKKKKKKNKQEKVIPIIYFPTSVAEVKILQVRTRKL